MGQDQDKTRQPPQQPDQRQQQSPQQQQRESDPWGGQQSGKGAQTPGQGGQAGQAGQMDPSRKDR